MTFLLAVTPILLILVLMVGFRWGAVRAGGAGYLSALLIAILFFGARLDLLAVAHAKAFFLTVDVLFIIWAAFVFYRVTDEAGAVSTIGQSLPHLTAERSFQAVIIGWVFASFLQGMGGFGVPVAVVAPILIGLGFHPLSAIIIPSVGHGWAVTFGSLGTSFQALISVTGLSAGELAPASATFLGLTGMVTGLLVAHAAGGWEAMRKLWLPVLGIGLAMALVQYGVAVVGMWNIASFAGSLAGLAAALLLARFYRGERPEGTGLDGRSLSLALAGYAILVLVIFFVQTVPAVRQFLGRVVIQAHFPQVSTTLGYVTPAEAGRAIPIFRHAGATLLYASGLCYLLFLRAGKYQPGAPGRIARETITKVLPSSVSIASMVTMAVIMEHTGMTDALARSLAEATGRAFPLAAPWIGALGAFMTGSNTNSNVVFGALQQATASLLGYPAAIILAGQTSGGAVGSVVAPAKIVVGTSTAGMAGGEGDVMRKLLVYVGILILVISALTLLFSGAAP